MLDKLINKIQKAKKKPGWLTKLWVMLGLLVVIAVYVSFMFFKARREATVLHKKDMVIENLRQKEMSLKYAVHEKEIEEAEKDIVAAQQAVEETNKELEGIEKERQNKLDIISKIKDFDDVDELVVFHNK